MKLFPNWKNFIRHHPDKVELNLKMEELSSFISPGDSIEDGFQILESSPSSVLLTYDPVSKEIIPSFYHTSIGNELVESVWKIGLTGSGPIACPISFGDDVFSSFKSTNICVLHSVSIISLSSCVICEFIALNLFLQSFRKRQHACFKVYWYKFIVWNTF